MRIESERIYLRNLAAADCTPEYLSWLQDPHVNRYLETRHHEHTIQTLQEFVARVNGRLDERLFGIFLHEGGRHIGNIKVGPINAHHRLAELSLLIGAQDCWGKGYATDAIRGLTAFSFAELGIRKLSAGMYRPNRGSCRAFEKVGYRQEGNRRGHYLLNGEPCDIVEYGLLSAEFF